MRELIVNADDFGRSEAINRGVVTAYENGIVTSASLMVRWPAAEAAAAYAGERGLGVGLHLDLGEWIFRTETWTPLYEVVDLNDRNAVDEELDRQLKHFRDLMGAAPTHLDSHQHVHLREPVRTAVAATGAALDIPVRGISSWISTCGDFYGQTAEGRPLASATTPEALAAAVAGVGEGITELTCHPGLDERESVYGRERDDETAALCDAAVAAAVRRLGLSLRSFEGLGFAGPR